MKNALFQEVQILADQPGHRKREYLNEIADDASFSVSFSSGTRAEIRFL